jgi:hypothetical protein
MLTIGNILEKTNYQLVIANRCLGEFRVNKNIKKIKGGVE